MSTDSAPAVCITGTSRGIGKALAEHFLSAGIPVIGVSRTQSPLSHPQFHQVQADLSEPNAVEALEKPLSHFAIRGLINNAGIHGPIGPFETNDWTQWMRALQVNCLSAARITQLCVPSLRRHLGSVIFLSGGGAAFPRPNFSAYAVSKTAVVRLAENLSRELAPDVLVYCVAPGPNATALLEEAVRAGTDVPAHELVDVSCPVRLCDFLMRNRDPRYSGKFIHVKDNYAAWGDMELATDMFTLRRARP